MTIKPEKLQGTDGIRGRIAQNKDRGETNPVDFFLIHNRLTPDFFEKYTYAFGTLLIDSGFAGENDEIIIGWDPRDQEGTFNQAAINGIRKAGLKAVVVGTLPTPAIPLYMQSVGASASVVLTASHNPSDQNGIKLFCGYTALKLLPRDDIQLTNRIYQQTPLNLSQLDCKGEREDRENQAKEFFVKFCLDSRNSWLEGKQFKDTILVIDASNGAVASVAKDVFSTLPFHQVVFTNLEGNINQTCGVADIEGLEFITRENVQGSGSKFAGYETLNKIFELAEPIRNNSSNALKLTGLVFDGDGDRCYRLDYIPESDSIKVSSGDHLGIHQAKYLLKKNPDADGLFVNTVESDLNTAITAREMGFTPVLTGVGDKWILSRAVIDMIQSQLPQDTKLQDQFKQLINHKDGYSALEISAFWKSILKNHPSGQTGKRQFQIGLEESGHCITPGFIDKEGTELVCFSGNGIKTGLNSLQAVSVTVDSDSWYDTIVHPFSAGICKTFYTYYVDKSRLNPGSPFRQKLQETLQSRFPEVFPSTFSITAIGFPEEPEMLYFSILENNKQCAAIFARNSGTEEKSALYLRGEARLEQWLYQLGNELHLLMLAGLKKRDSDFTRFQIELLENLNKKKPVTSLLEIKDDLPRERILKEIELKEGLIERSQGRLEITEKGRNFISSW